MFQYVAARLLWLVPTILAMALVTFLVMHATPGSPLDPVAEGANPLSPEGQRALAKFYGLDKPLYEQFWIFVTKAVRGDFGYSFVTVDGEVGRIQESEVDGAAWYRLDVAERTVGPRVLRAVAAPA